VRRPETVAGLTSRRFQFRDVPGAQRHEHRSNSRLSPAAGCPPIDVPKVVRKSGAGWSRRSRCAGQAMELLAALGVTAEYY
jgi:hypothetical protein